MAAYTRPRSVRFLRSRIGGKRSLTIQTLRRRYHRLPMPSELLAQSTEAAWIKHWNIASPPICCPSSQR